MSITAFGVTVGDVLAGIGSRRLAAPGVPVRIALQLPRWLSPKNQEQESEAPVAEQLQDTFFEPNSSPVWNGILNAAPKKKTSHQKKRQRQLAGNKQLKLKENLDRCPSCGHVKRSHFLCMNCVNGIKQYWKSLDKKEGLQDPSESANEEYIQLGSAQEPVSKIDARVNYPGKRKVFKDLAFEDKEEYLERRPKTLPYDKNCK